MPAGMTLLNPGGISFKVLFLPITSVLPSISTGFNGPEILLSFSQQW